MCYLCSMDGIFTDFWKEAHDGKPLAKQRARARTLKQQIKTAEELNEKQAAKGVGPAVSQSTIDNWREQLAGLSRML